MKKIFASGLMLMFFIISFGQIPSGYYDSATGTGSTLKTQLFNIIKSPSVTSYDGLWTAFQTTDVDNYYENDGSVMDIYSENPTGADPYNYSYTADQCGNYSGEGVCYNREHSFPKSWFNDATPMYSDLFHIYPTDGKVNGERSNYPYGQNDGESFTSQNGSKLGACTYPGYTGTVFEPIDEFKGDLARTYFYMITCYEDKITGWNSVVLDGNTYPGYTSWFLDMLIEWNNQDPVSQKEIDRNDSIYKIQGNRNPYIDHPEYVCQVFNSSNCSTSPTLFVSSSSISNYSYIVGNGPSSSQSFTLSGSNLDGSQVSVSAPTDYEISTDNSSFSTSANISYTAPTLSSTTIYVRLKAELPIGTYDNETITCSDNGTASDVTVSNNGEVTSSSSGNGLIINEIAANPGGSYNNEYVELYNDSNSSIDLNGYSLIIKRSGSSDVTINIGSTGTNIGGTTISANGYFVITRGTVSFSPRIEYGSFYLNKNLHVILQDASSNQVDIAGSNYEFNPGNNYELCSPSTDNAIFSNWTEQGTSYAGTPGSLNNATCASSASLLLSPTSLSGFSYILGQGPSSSQSFSLSGSNLDGSQVSITAPADYEISTDNSTFSSSLNISYTAPDLSSTTIYVRLKAGLSVGVYNNENITCTDDGSASTVTETVNGEVLQPTLSLSPTSLSGFSYIVSHGPSNSQNFDLSGSNLDGTKITISAPSNYEISTDNSTFSSSLNISYTAPTLSATTIYVRLKSGLSVGTYSNETITCDDDGNAANVTETTSGEVLQPTLSISPTSLSNLSYTFGHGPSLSQSFDISGSNLDGSQVSISAPTNYEISTDNSTFSSSLNISYTTPTLSATTIYVRLKNGLSVDTYNNKTITCSDNGNASNITETVSGEVKNASASCATDLIISEVIESSSDKYLEIANYTGSAVSLVNYDLVIYSNGATSPSTTIDLDDATSIPDQDVFVISYLNSDNWSGTENQTTGSLNFNGNDVIALRKNSTNIDVFGTIGNSSYFNDDKLVTRSSFISSPTTSYNISDWNFSDYSDENPSSLGSHTMSCICEEPTVEASNISFSSILSTSLNVSWTNGDGLNRIVVMKAETPVDWLPTDNNSYIANSDFSSGTEQGTGNYIIFNGTGNSVNISNLSPGTIYYFKIFEYNCQPGSEDYLSTGSPVEGNTTTSPEEITNFLLVCGTGTSADLSWTLPNGNYDGILITGLQGAEPDAPSCNGNTLTNPITDFSSAQIYCSNASGSIYLFNNIGTNVNISGLTEGNSYTFKAFVYKNSTWSTGTNLTFTSQVSNVANLTDDCGNTTCDLSWTNPNTSCFDEVMVVAHATSSVSATPSGDGSSYSANASFGSGTDIGTNEFVVFKGTAETCNITNLTNGTDYYYKVFVRKSLNWSTGTEVNCAPSTASKFDYGDLAIVGINTNIDDAGPLATDEIQFLCFKDITPETTISLTDNGYERLYAGKWGDSEGIINITRKNSSLAAGTLVVLQGYNDASKWHVFIGDGTDSQTFISDDANWTITDGGTGNNQFNLNSSDQIWMMQGGEWINPAGVQNATYTGKVLYGWTATGWESAPGYNSTSGSTLFGKSSCSQTNVVGVANQDKVKYNNSITAVTQREWISRFNNGSNWAGFADSTAYFDGGVLPDIIDISGSGFSTTAQWTGETNSDWNECTNWLNLKVPDNSSNVIFIADNCYNDIVVNSGDTIICNNLTIQGTSATHTIKIEGTSNTILEIHGNLTIDLASILDFDDGNSSTANGKIKIYGNWINNVGTNGFLQGNSTVEFIGNSQQTISTSDSQEDFYNLILNNSSAEGVIINKNIVISDSLTLENGLLGLNGQDLTISGNYLKTNGVFKGNSGSNITINGTGELADFNFATPQIINNFSMNRNGHTAELSSSLTMSNLTISSGIVQLDAGKFYTVSNTITNSVGATGLILKSNVSGTASLIHYSENIPATCERYITGGIWSYFFSPLNNVPKSLFSSTLGFYYYNEVNTDYWQNHDSYGTSGWVTESATNLSTNKGYIAYTKNSNIFSLSGGNLYFDATNNNKVFTLSYTDSGTGAINQNGVTSDWDIFEGWNLIGNPFTSAVDWTKITLSNVEDVIYYYDGVSKNYKYYGTGTVFNEGITVNGGSQYIPANQSFFVKASANNGTVTIPNSARVNNSQLYLKKNNSEIKNFIKLKTQINKLSDETVIHFSDKATKKHDNFDGYKFFPANKNVPQIFSIDSNNIYYSINNLPINENMIIKLGFYAKDAGNYFINTEKINYFGYHIYLIDNEKNKKINIQENPLYQFAFHGGYDNNRFELSINKNRKPFIVNAIKDCFGTTNEQFSFDIIENSFADPDLGDYLTYSCKLTDGSDLPDYLSFENGKISGIFSNPVNLSLKITATDKFGLESTQNFKLIISKQNDIQDQEKSFIIFPNPANKMVNIYIPQILDNTKIKIFDATGKLRLNKMTSIEENSLDISSLNSGIYIIEIKNEIIKEQQKLIVK